MSDAEALDRPFVAGMYDYYLGGTANSAADRAAVERIKLVVPDIEQGAWANRGFLQRAVRAMAADWGIRQFIDVGAGLPTQRNTHEVVADAIGDDGRVLYVDNDPRVIGRGQVMLGHLSNAEVIEADLRDPDVILNHPETKRLIDFAEPVGLLFVAVTQFLSDEDDPWGKVHRFVEVAASGSYLAVSGPTSDHQADRVVDHVLDVYAQTPTAAHVRTHAQMTRFFEGLEIIPPYPGAVPAVAHAGLWGAEDPEAADDDGSRMFLAAVARKP